MRCSWSCITSTKQVNFWSEELTPRHLSLSSMLSCSAPSCTTSWTICKWKKLNVFEPATSSWKITLWAVWWIGLWARSLDRRVERDGPGTAVTTTLTTTMILLKYPLASITQRISLHCPTSMARARRCGRQKRDVNVYNKRVASGLSSQMRATISIRTMLVRSDHSMTSKRGTNNCQTPWFRICTMCSMTWVW